MSEPSKFSETSPRKFVASFVGATDNDLWNDLFKYKSWKGMKTSVSLLNYTLSTITLLR